MGFICNDIYGYRPVLFSFYIFIIVGSDDGWFVQPKHVAAKEFAVNNCVDRLRTYYRVEPSDGS
jgi:hypothetical protein